VERKLKPGDLVRVTSTWQLGLVLVIERHGGFRLPTATVLIGSRKRDFYLSSLELAQKAHDGT